MLEARVIDDNDPDMLRNRILRRQFLQGAALAGASVVFPRQLLSSGFAQARDTAGRLVPFGYGDVTLNSDLHEKQLENTHSVLMGLARSGDGIELELQSKIRLEAIDAQHRDTVAVLHDPLVLFAVTEAAPRVTKKQLLAAKLEGEMTWRVETADGAMTMLPFTAIADEQYSSYLVTRP